MKKNILFITNNMRTCNGVATVLMNQYQALVDAGYKVDILQFLDIDSVYVDKIHLNGGKVITYKISDSKLENFKRIKQFYEDNDYDIVHINHTDIIAVMFIWCAKITKVPVIVYHSHNTKLKGDFKRNLKSRCYDFLCVKGSNLHLACSIKAGEDVFGKSPFIVLHNAIDVKKFKFNLKCREDIRNELGIENDTFVVGTVCRYADQKNPIFMYEIFSSILKSDKKAIFLWVGSAASESDPIIEEMQRTAKKLDIENNLRLVGSKDDVYRWYSAMDVFLMPSKFEGLGITYIEAQANGLPTFASNVVPKDAAITPLFHSLSLDTPAETWASKMHEFSVRNAETNINYEDEISKRGYNITKSNSELLRIYRDKLVEK